MVNDKGGFMRVQQDRGALRLVHPAAGRESVKLRTPDQILAIAEQRNDDLPAAGESVVDEPAAGESKVERVFRVLEVFTEGPRQRNLSDMARQARLPISTTHRLATQLVGRGVLLKDDSGRYSIGPALLAIAARTVHDDSDSDR